VALAALTAGITAASVSSTTASVAAAVTGAAAVVLLGAGAALRAPVLVAPAAAFLGAGYAIGSAVDGGATDLEAPLVGAALLLTCELAYWSHELRTTSPDEPGAAPRRAAWLALLAAAAYLAGAVVLASADLVRVEGIAVETIGALAAAIVVGGVVVLARGGRATEQG
jgi:hypothetical protein